MDPSNMDFVFPIPGKYTVYTKSGCTFCRKAEQLLDEKKLEYEQINCDEYLLGNREQFLLFVKFLANKEFKTFPMIFDATGTFVGGFTDLKTSIDQKLDFAEDF